MLKKLFVILILHSFSIGYSQIEKEIEPPFNIKTVSFVQNNKNVLPFSIRRIV